MILTYGMKILNLLLNEKITKIINNEGKETQKEENSENNTNTKNSKGDKLVLSFNIDPGMCK